MTSAAGAAPTTDARTANAHPESDADAASRLTQALDALGIACRVESRGRLALLVARDPAPLADPATRRRVAALAAERGFTHVALELDLPSDRS